MYIIVSNIKSMVLNIFIVGLLLILTIIKGKHILSFSTNFAREV